MSAASAPSGSSILSIFASGLYDLINGAFALDQIDNIVRSIWHHHYKGELTDEEATFLANIADKRRPLGRRTSSAPGVVTAKPLAAPRSPGQPFRAEAATSVARSPGIQGAASPFGRF